MWTVQWPHCEFSTWSEHSLNTVAHKPNGNLLTLPVLLEFSKHHYFL